ncbi:substrate-binding periplasmic protein [Litoribrevibacter albus]|nr:transporter substrate-binding domain-containing protein [Litoribrevibacter albus]
MNHIKAMLVSFFLFLTVFASPYLQAKENQIYLTSLEWPPYSGAELPDGGAAISIAKAAFEEMGYELVVEFYPWSRALIHAKDPDSPYAGYFPEYYSKDREAHYLFSRAIGSGPLGFVEQAEHPIKWNSLSDLTAYTIGVVRDYVNTPEFDVAVLNGQLSVQEVSADVQNIWKVLNGRIPLAVIDRNVFEYLVYTDMSLALADQQVRMNPKLLDIKELYVCFNKAKNGAHWQKIFNEGLLKLDVAKMMSDYFEKIGIERN